MLAATHDSHSGIKGSPEKAVSLHTPLLQEEGDVCLWMQAEL